jgi:hypothetical protein
MNAFIIGKGATWANYVLFDNEGKPVTSLEYEFVLDEK